MTRGFRDTQVALLAVMLVVDVVQALATPTESENAPGKSLTDLLVSRFGNLWPAERRLVAASEIGETADCTDLIGDNKMIRGELLAWLCTNPQATAQLTYRGIGVVDAKIIGKVDLQWARVSFPITALNCTFSDTIDLSRSDIGFLNLGGSSITDLHANATHFEGDVFLRNGFKASRGVWLRTAKIDGTLDCGSGQFVGNDKVLAFDADSARIGRGVLLRDGFRAEGGVNLIMASVEGNLDCSDGVFIGNDKVLAINANSLRVKGGVFLRDGFKAEGGVDLGDANIGILECDGGQFAGNDKALAIDANGIEVKRSVFLRNGFKADGGVNLGDANIGVNFECDGGQFVGNDKVVAINANGIEVKGSVFLRNGFKAEGGVNLVKANIGINLECDGGQFVGNDKVLAMNANGIEVKGSVFLRNGFKADGGGVNLGDADIGVNLECDGGQFVGNNRVDALSAYLLRVKGAVFLRYGFKAVGLVNLAFSKIDGDIELQDGHFSTQAHGALNLQGAKTGPLFNTATGSQDGWPRSGYLQLDGFDYERIQSKPNAEFQLGWLRRQARDQFRSQPFEQLADVLRKMGLDEDARAVMIAKNIEHARYVQWRPEWLWYGFLGHLIGYGYSPWRAFFLSLAVIVIGWFIFRRGYRRGLVTPTGDAEFTVETDGVRPNSENYPKFNAFVYSLETFVPLVKMGVGDHWMPNANRGNWFRFGPAGSTTGGWLRVYYWFHITAGWVLSALWVGGITGLVKT